MTAQTANLPLFEARGRAKTLIKIPSGARYADLALAPALDVASNPFLGRGAHRVTILRPGRAVRQMWSDTTSVTAVIAFMTGATIENVAQIER